MKADDPRHGTARGNREHYRQGERPCAACSEANAIAQRRYRKVRALYGPRTISTRGIERRVQALMCVGWSTVAIAREAGVGGGTDLWNKLNRPSGRVHTRTAQRIAEAYERLAATRPPETTTSERISASRTRAHAKRLGYLPPLAWDDIDRDPEPPTPDDEDFVDEVVVERILGGDYRLRASDAERAEVCRRWTGSGRSLRSLGLLTGWKPERYWKNGEAA